MQTLTVREDGTTVIEFEPAEGRALRNKLLDLPGSPAAHQLQRVLAMVHGEAYEIRHGGQQLPLDQFEAVISTSDGSYSAADEYRCRACGAIGGQGVEPKSLVDLVGMARRHECLPRVTKGEAQR